MHYLGLLGAFCVFVAFLLILYRLHYKEENLIAGAGFVFADTAGNDASALAKRFVGREVAVSYVFKGPCRHGCRPAYLFKHVPSGDEPPITSLVIESDMHFEQTAVVHKVYGSHFLFRVAKKLLIKTGDLGVEGEDMVELNEFNGANFERYGLFAMGEPGFDTENPDFIKLAGALRAQGRKAVVGLGLSGRDIAAWSAQTAQLLDLWKKLLLLDVVFTVQEGQPL